jgi:predicted O-methyltransferase YrrM
MTTREATGYLPRALEGATPGRSLADWAALIAVGAVQWPWLLRSLAGGGEAKKQALLHRLDLPPDALPTLGSWKADAGLLTLLADHILAHRPRLVVEFGTGASTLIVAKALQMAGGGTLISFEQHRDFVDATAKWLADHGLRADLRAVPLVPSPNGWPGVWYDHGRLDGIDLLVVDGPPWTIHPLTRGSASSLFPTIRPGGTIVLDDAARPGERLIARRWRRDFPDFRFELVNSGTKGTLIGSRLG